MKQITFHLDFISPYAWLAFAQLPQALQGISHHMQYRPVLLGALLQRHANPGPAGIAGKREWTYRHVSWLGHASGVGLDMPARHPFNPLPLLRLALECSDDGTINRFVADAVLRHVWLGGADALDPARLDVLRATLAPQLRTDAADKARRLLRENTDAAAAQGLFGVPAWEVDGRLFWGLDSLPMLRSYLQGDGWFDNHWDAAASVEQGLKV
ncbi:MAG: DsbA family protein [Delftia acidovorans]|jgi:2-hydroxychromene-2-carboxylate isomerase|nr:DsbA family protein [Delftia acidovorans]